MTLLLGITAHGAPLDLQVSGPSVVDQLLTLATFSDDPNPAVTRILFTGEPRLAHHPSETCTASPSLQGTPQRTLPYASLLACLPLTGRERPQGQGLCEEVDERGGAGGP